MRDNRFYVTKQGEYTYFIPKQEWTNGVLGNAAENTGCLNKINVTGFSRFSFTLVKHKYVQVCRYEFFDVSNNKIGSIQIPYLQDSEKNPEENLYEVDIPLGSAYMYVNIDIEASHSANEIAYKVVDYFRMHRLNPHYKTLKLKTEKKDDQMFFRNSLDGKVILYRGDYDFIVNSDLETVFKFFLYRGEKRLVESKFNKTDCKFNFERNSVELALNADDSYTKILDAYDKTFDLLKLGIGKTEIKLTKRGVVQVYILGEKTITNYCAGTVHEYEVVQPIDDLSTLQNTYYFGAPETYRELSFSGFNYNINVNAAVLNDGSQEIKASFEDQHVIIKFKKIASKDEKITSYQNERVVCLSDDNTSAVYISGVTSYAKYDIYKIQIYSADSILLYESVHSYGNDNGFKLGVVGNTYQMKYNAQVSPQPNPQTFYLGNMIIAHKICMRILCDTPTSVDGKTTLYPLPTDDFAVENMNYKYCIGLNFKNADSEKIVNIKASTDYQAEPTPYGLTEQGVYFVQPRYIAGSRTAYLYPFPLAKSSWGNVSLWIGFDEYTNPITNEPFGVERLLRNYSRQFYHKDAMEVGDIIKALLNKIDSTIMFEPTEEFSQFLYGSISIGTAKYKQKILLTQKSNILKGEYDQAAQKAEITFKQLMETLRDCYRCYWYIDEQKRFRLEHISFFMNGLSYMTNQAQNINLIATPDKFNKKPALYDQKKLSFTKSELSSRYEFAWADGTISEAMGGGFNVDVKSNYTQADKIENISTQNISSDIDMMFYKPDEFSMDGFALLSVNNDNTIEVEKVKYYRDNNDVPVITYVQNFNASFLRLFENYLYDMPARSLVSSVDNLEPTYPVSGIKRCMEHEIEVQLDRILSPYTTITTNFGAGVIDFMKTNIDTLKSEITLKYEPS